MSAMDATGTETWRKTACIICALNCGLEVQTGGEGGRHITKIRGDKAHPVSKGYVCEKSQRMDHYQNGADRLTSPMRRRADGHYEAIDWDTAIREIAQKFAAIKARYGGESILYFGGANQGSHLGGTYGDSTQKALGVRYRSNALAQEKTGEFWVAGKMLTTGAHGDFEHCEVAVFVGKNPWQSHGFARTRVVLRDIQKDPARSLIVIDPRRSETAAMADYHLQVRPGTDAWCLAALAAIIVQEDLVAHDWIAVHTTGYAEIGPVLQRIPVARFAAACGVDEQLLRRAARRIAGARSVSMMEDLGLQMNVHSTLAQLPAASRLAVDRPLREARHQQFVRAVPVAREGEQGRGIRQGGRRGCTPAATAQPRGRRQDHHRTHSLQRDSRGDPHRSPQALSRDADRVRQSGAFARGQPAHACRDPRARPQCRDRRGDDRDRARSRLRAARVQPVREGGGDVLQPRVPAQRLPPAAAAFCATAGHAAGSRDPRATGGGAGRIAAGRLHITAARGATRAGLPSRSPSRGNRHGIPGSADMPESCSTGLSAMSCRTS